MAATERCLEDGAKLLRLWRNRWEADGSTAAAVDHHSQPAPYEPDLSYLSDHSEDDGSPVIGSLREGQPNWLWESQSRGRPGCSSDEESDDEDLQPRLTPARQQLARRSPSSPPPSCWICYEHSDKSDIIAPCEVCTGSLAHVHSHCISTWVSTRQTLTPSTPHPPTHPTHRPHCPNCKTPYRKGALHPERSPSATSPPLRIPGLRRSASAHLAPLTLTTTVTTTTVTTPHGAVSSTSHLALTASGSSTVTSAPIHPTRCPALRGAPSPAPPCAPPTTTPLRRSSSSVRITSWRRTTTIPHLDVVTVTPKAQGPMLSCYA